MATPNLVPRADSEGGIGTASKYWASAYIDLIYVGAGKIGRDADNLLDFSTDNFLQIRVNANTALGVESGALFPIANDGMGLGYVNRQWSDLFLASGAVINFGGDNVTLTHSSNALTLADSDKLNFGTGGDMKIYHDGSGSYIENGTGNLNIMARADDADIIFYSDDGSGGDAAYLTLDGSVKRNILSQHTNAIDNIGIYIGTSLDFGMLHDGTDTYLTNDSVAGSNLYIRNATDDADIIFQCDNGSGGLATYITLDGGATKTIFSKNLRLLDDVQLDIGSSDDFRIVHTSANNATFVQNFTGDLTFTQNADDGDIIFQSDNGAGGVATYFYLDGSSAAHDGSATTALYTNWPDKSRISLGTSHDLLIQHDATDSLVDNNTGNLYIRQQADDKDIIFQCDDGSGGVETYFFLDGSLGSDPYTIFPDSSTLALGTGYDLRLVHDGSNSVIQNNTGNLTIRNKAADSSIIFQADDGSSDGSTVETYFQLEGASGGGTPFTVFPDSSTLAFGSGHDLQIFHDGTDSKMLNAVGDLIFENRADDKDIIFKSDNGSGGFVEYFRLDGSAVRTISSQHISMNDGKALYVGEGLDAGFYHSGGHNFLETNSGNLTIVQNTDDGDIILQCDDGSGGTTAYLTLDGSASTIEIAKNTNSAGDIAVTKSNAQISATESGGATTRIMGASVGRVGTSSNHNLEIQTNSTTAITVDTSTNTTFAGRIMLGSGTPVRKLELKNINGARNFGIGLNDKDGTEQGTIALDHNTNDLISASKANIRFFTSSTIGDIATLPTNQALLLDTSKNATFAGTVNVTSATGTAEGGGIDATDAVSIQVGEINGEIITTIFVDIGVGSIQSSSTNTGAIGNATDAAAYITRVTTAVNGIVYKAELICVEVPTVASGALSADIDLTANSSSIASGSAVSGTPICNSGGDATLGRLVKSSHSSSNTITPNDYLYLAQGDTNAGVYNAGKFLIRLYGAKTTGL